METFTKLQMKDKDCFDLIVNLSAAVKYKFLHSR